ncbi:hypothetical protein HDE_12333 [Halotydeus destructor]|nr:hypothetical protein HDE_12333 [Halotydeus destructor]
MEASDVLQDVDDSIDDVQDVNETKSSGEVSETGESDSVELNPTATQNGGQSLFYNDHNYGGRPPPEGIPSTPGSEPHVNGKKKGQDPAKPNTWANSTGLKAKQFSPVELEAFKKPFELGWKREVVLRGTVTNSGKKIGDVYYFYPEKKVKLRSNVELGLFLKKHPDCGLEPENFTFARQPVFKAPEEIVRNAMQRGCNGHQPLAETPPQVENSPIETVNGTPNQAAIFDETKTVAEGRGKRKSKAPTRFEDEDFAEQSPFKKKIKEKPTAPPLTPAILKPVKSQNTKSLLNPNKKASLGGQTLLKKESSQLVVSTEQAAPLSPPILLKSHSALIAAENTAIQQEATDVPNLVKSEPENEQVTEPSEGDSIKLETAESVSEPVTELTETAKPEKAVSPAALPPKSDQPQKKILGKPRNRTKAAGFKPIRPKPSILHQQVQPLVQSGDSSEMMDFSIHAMESIDMTKIPMPPCSMTCYGRKGSLPTSQCHRCLCMFHVECVPSGIILNDSNDFVCPNCVQQNDLGTSVSAILGVNGHHEIGDSHNAPMSRTKPRLSMAGSRPPSAGSAKNVPQLIPKPPKLFKSQSKSAKMSSVQANGYTQRGQPQQIVQRSGHLQINSPIFTQKQKSSKTKRQNLTPGLMSRNQHQFMSKMIHNQLQMYQYPAVPIAPIAPIKVTPEQVASLLERTSKKQRMYRDYMLKAHSSMTMLAGGYNFLTTALSYLSIKDLLNIKLVNRTFKNMSSQPMLWKTLRLKSITLTDWEYLGQKIIEPIGSTEVNFDGIRIPSSSSLNDTWKQFSSIVDFLKSVNRLQFGIIPAFVIEEIIGAALNQNPYNSFAKLESLVVKNVYDSEATNGDANKAVAIGFLKDLSIISGLKTLHIASKSGLNVDGQHDLLETIFSGLKQLTSLSLPNLKASSAEQFSFLSSQSQLEELEVGSCVSWNTLEEQNTEEENELRGVYKYLGDLVNLRKLKLVEIIIDDSSIHLPLALQQMPLLECLAFDSLTISPDATLTLDVLTNTLQSRLPNLKHIAINSDDSQTNRCVFDLVKKIKNLKEVTWKVGAIVEDSGECFVPLAKERAIESDVDGEMDLTSGEENSEIIDITVLTELLQKHLNETKIFIYPQ